MHFLHKTCQKSLGNFLLSLCVSVPPHPHPLPILPTNQNVDFTRAAVRILSFFFFRTFWACIPVDVGAFWGLPHQFQVPLSHGQMSREWRQSLAGKRGTQSTSVSDHGKQVGKRGTQSTAVSDHGKQVGKRGTQSTAVSDHGKQVGKRGNQSTAVSDHGKQVGKRGTVYCGLWSR